MHCCPVRQRSIDGHGQGELWPHADCPQDCAGTGAGSLYAWEETVKYKSIAGVLSLVTVLLMAVCPVATKASAGRGYLDQ